jgi:hypothetical protein
VGVRRNCHYANRNGGHCPGHIRETFLRALDAYLTWGDSTDPPTIEHEVHYQPQEISLAQACGLVWNCSDILPASAWSMIEGSVLADDVRRRSYAAAARAIHARLKADA